MADRSVKVVLSANVTAFERDMKLAAARTRGVYEASKDAEERLRMQTQAMTELGQGALVMGGLMAVGIGAAVMAYANFDQAMSAVQASTMESASNMELLRQAAIDAGADTQFSATEAANAIDELAKAGLSTTDILTGGLAGALDLAAAGGLGVARAAEISATTLSQFGLAGEEASHVADVLAAGAGKALGSVDDLAQGLKFVGPVAASMGISLEETTGVLALFAQQGIIGEQAGTSLRGVLSSLTSPSKAARAEIERLGLSLYDSQGKFLGLENAAGQLSGAYKTMDGASRDASMGIIFGRETVTAATALYQSGAEGVAEWTEAVDDSGFAAEQAQMKMDNLMGDLEALGGSWETFLINTGSGADGPLRGLVQTLDAIVDGLGQLPGPILDLGLGAAALATGVLLIGGAGLVIIPQIASTVTALTTLGVTAGTATAAVTRLKGVMSTSGTWWFAAAALAALALEEQTKRTELSVNDLATAISNATSAQTMFTDAGRVDETWADTIGLDWDKQLADLDDMAGALEKMRAYDEAPWFTKLDMGEANTIETYKQSLQGVGEALSQMPAEEAAERFSLIREEYKLTTEQMADMLQYMPEYQNGLAEQASGLGLVEGAVDTYEERLALAKFALEGGAVAGEEFAESLDEGAEAAAAQAEELQALQDAIFDAADAMRSLIGNENSYYEQLGKTAEIIAENGQTLDVMTEAGRANRAALSDLAGTAMDVAKSMIETGDESAVVNEHLASSREEFLKAAESAGLLGAEAEALANELGLVPLITPLEISDGGTITQADAEVEALLNQLIGLPPNTDVHTTAFTEDAKLRLAELGVVVTTLPDGTVVASAETAVAESALNQVARDREAYITMRVDNSQLSTYYPQNTRGDADGGFYEHNIAKFANGGLMRPLPAGSVPSGIYRGGADIVHFAEPETRWEAYISGKPGMEARNLRIWEEAGRRLGKEVVSLGGNRVAALADGGIVRNGGGDVRATQFATQAARSVSTSIITDNSKTIAPTIPGANQDIGLLVDKVVQAIRREDRWQS